MQRTLVSAAAAKASKAFVQEKAVDSCPSNCFFYARFR